MITAVPNTVAATERLTTPVLGTTSTIQLPTTPSFLGVSTLPPPPAWTGRIPVVTSGVEASPAVTTSAVDAGPGEDLDPAVPLFIPPPDPDFSTPDVVTSWSPRTPHEAKGALGTVETPEVTTRSTPFPAVEAADSEPFLDPTQPPSPGPSQRSRVETGREDPDPEVSPRTPEETDVPTESAHQPGNDTASFSAATLLSGDGELDHPPQAHPHMLGPDSDLDYLYDPADGFLPVSLASIRCSLTFLTFRLHLVLPSPPPPLSDIFSILLLSLTFFPFITFLFPPLFHIRVEFK